MSVKVMGLVWDSDLTANPKLVLLAYADISDHDGNEIWPGRERIAVMTGCSIATVDRITRQLLKGGYLIQVGKGYRGRRAAYRIPLDRLRKAYQPDTLSDVDSLSADAESLSPDAGKPITGDTPPVLDPSSTPVLKTAATPQRNGDYMTALVDIFGEPDHWSHYQSVIMHIQEHGGTPEDIPRRVALLVAEWGQGKATPASLKKWWTRYDAQISQVSDGDVEEFVEQQRRVAGIARLSDE